MVYSKTSVIKKNKSWKSIDYRVWGRVEVAIFLKSGQGRLHKESDI